MDTDEKVLEEVKAVAAWFDSLSDDFKNHVAFRAQRVGDPEMVELHEAIKAAGRIAKEAKRHRG